VFDEDNPYTMNLLRGQRMTFPIIDAAQDEVRLNELHENPQFFLPDQCEAKPRARPQAVIVPDERAEVGDFDFRPRWWPGAYLREV
jgi:hypothetical protein